MNSTPSPQPEPQPPPGSGVESSTGETQKLAKPDLSEIKELMQGHRTLASLVKAHFEPVYMHIPRFAQGPTPEADRARFDRAFRPWPKWVLRLAAEHWHVGCPTIESGVFFQTFRVMRICFFRCPFNRATFSSAIVKGDVFDRIDLRVFTMVAAAYAGHAFEHLQAARKELDAKRMEGKISEQEYAEQIKGVSTEGVESMMREHFTQWAEIEGVKPFDLTRAVETARNKTFDRHGQIKETPLTPIYRKMLENWMAIERMSGPKELTHFLLPTLGDKEFYVAYDRVKKICSRIGVRFNPPVKQI